MEQQQKYNEAILCISAEDCREAGLFDHDWYNERYPDVASASLDAFYHYHFYGRFEFRNPGPMFDTEFYLTTYPDVAAAGDNPLVHYICKGRDEGRHPNRSRLEASLANLICGRDGDASFRELINDVATRCRPYWETNVVNFQSALAQSSKACSWSMTDTYWNVLRRLPENAELCRNYVSVEERVNHIWACISSHEFRIKLPERLSQIFADRKKVVFLHIPRTGGTTVREHFESGLNLVTWNFSFETMQDISEFPYMNGNTLSYHDFLARLLVQMSDIHLRPLVISGHISLEDALARKLIAPTDICFSIIRNPLQIITSLIKYKIQLAQYHSYHPDNKSLVDWFSRLDPFYNPQCLRSSEFLSKIVQSEELALGHSNPLTRGFTNSHDFAKALDNISIAGCRIFNIENPKNIDFYLRDTLNIRSDMIMKNDTRKMDVEFSSADIFYINSNLVDKDYKIYDVLNR